MSGNGYIPKRRGVLDHLQGGRLTLLEYGAYDAMILLADKSSGIWWGSAKALAAICGAGDLTERQARHLLESLGSKGYIRRFATAGKRGNYPIFVNKFEVTYGARKGMRLNAERTTDWRHPVYESCQVHGEVQGEVRAPIREGDRDNRHTPSVTVSATTKPTLEFEQFWKLYPKKRAKEDAIRAWRKIQPEDIPTILAAVEWWKRTEDWRREGGRYVPYPATFLNGRRWQDQPSDGQERSTVEEIPFVEPYR